MDAQSTSTYPWTTIPNLTLFQRSKFSVHIKVFKVLSHIYFHNSCSSIRRLNEHYHFHMWKRLGEYMMFFIALLFLFLKSIDISICMLMREPSFITSQLSIQELEKLLSPKFHICHKGLWTMKYWIFSMSGLTDILGGGFQNLYIFPFPRKALSLPFLILTIKYITKILKCTDLQLWNQLILKMKILTDKPVSF
jgi:hypothetical protein